MASMEIGLPPPGRLELRPKLLLKFAPSTVKLARRPSLPAKLMPLPPYGDRRVTSVTERETLGRLTICELLMLVAAPVFSVENFEEAEATTIDSARSSVLVFSTAFC